MADTTVSIRVIFRTYKLASTIFTLYCFAASSDIITKSSIERLNAIRSVTPLSRCLSQVKKSTAIYADCLTKSFLLFTSAVDSVPGFSS